MPWRTFMDGKISSHFFTFVKVLILDWSTSWSRFDYLDSTFDFCEKEVIGQTHEGQDMIVMKVLSSNFLLFLDFAAYVLGLQRRLRQQASHVDWQVLKDLMTEEWFPRKMFRCKILSAESTLGSGSALPQAPGCSTSWLRTMQTTRNSQMVWTGRWY